MFVKLYTAEGKFLTTVKLLPLRDYPKLVVWNNIQYLHSSKDKYEEVDSVAYGIEEVKSPSK